MPKVLFSETLLVMIHATLASMRVVKTGQKGKVGRVRVKKDNTLVTDCDKRSERAILKFLKKLSFPIWSEEVGRIAGRGQICFVVDPLDGTRSYRNGAGTSTVMVALYDAENRKILACLVGEPATDRIFYAEVGKGTWLLYDTGDLEKDLASAKRLKVWKGDLGSSSTVYVDGSLNFSADDYPTIPREKRGSLYVEVASVSHLMMLGTNCGHYALVAQGRGVVGAITTCRGGFWDTIPAFLVTEAGGIMRCFSNKDDTLHEVGPEDMIDANIVLVANNWQTSEVLTKMVLRTLS